MGCACYEALKGEMKEPKSPEPNSERRRASTELVIWGNGQRREHRVDGSKTGRARK